MVLGTIQLTLFSVRPAAFMELPLTENLHPSCLAVSLLIKPRVLYASSHSHMRLITYWRTFFMQMLFITFGCLLYWLTWRWKLLIFSVPRFPHLRNKDGKVGDLFVLFVKFYEFWLPSPPSSFWVIGFCFCFSWFALICYTHGNPTCLGFFVLFLVRFLQSVFVYFLWKLRCYRVFL